MLKWTLNGPKQSCLKNEDNLQLHTKSSDLSILKLKTSHLIKENQYTSTPLQTSISSRLDSSSQEVDTLKDLSSIMPELSNISPLTDHMKKESFETYEYRQIPDNHLSNHSSILQTFDVKHSPSGLISGPMLALRGVGIPDRYFKKPKYIAPRFLDLFQNVNEETLLETKMLQGSAKSNPKYSFYMESTLSSTKMGDVTLERMIDAILESNRKSRKRSHHQKQFMMSPTYTAAEDPASDLQDVWDSEKMRYRQRKQKLRARLTKKILFNEEQICSPLLNENTDPGPLRRQRCLRRKRKMNQITTRVVSSAQKLLHKSREPKRIRRHCRNVLMHNEMYPQKPLYKPNPDSEHNSSSDYEENETNSTLQQCIEDDYKILNNIKRKLSFNKI